METELNKVANIKIKGFKPLQGLLLASGAEWLKITHIPVDFVVDGTVVIRKKYITDIDYTPTNLFVERVLRLKEINLSNDLSVNLDAENSLFTSLMDQTRLIQIYLHEDRVSYVGKIVKVNDKTFRMRLLSTTAEWLEEYSFNYDSVRLVHITNDYIDSLSLLL
jgi:hypothetical protein